jgi:Domain of unknown function (DUF4349)
MRMTDEQIGAELRALRATPDPSFAATLDRRATAGFPAAKAKASDRELSWRLLAPVLTGLAAIAVVAVVVANTGVKSGSDSGTLGIESRTPPASTAVAPHAKAGLRAQQQISKGPAPQVLDGETGAPAGAAGSRPRIGHQQVQELSAALGLSTDAGQIQGAADGVVDVTNQYDGFVDSSDVHVGGSNGHAFFQLRIPAAHLREALDDLSGLGRVVSRDEGSANVTGAYVDAGKAYRQARAKVDSLLAQLRNATDPAQAASIRQQLVPARQQLVAAREALRGLKGRVTYAPVTVQIRADGDGSWSIGDAAGDAGDILKAIAGGTLVTLAVLVPLTALLALGWLGGRELNRRRREAALD